jgi:precorrin-2 dehydrogenase/sirohydrochlorin ferrochelatase
MVLPLAFKLQGQSVLVIGAGRIGVGKAKLLVDAGARVTIVAREQIDDLPAGIENFEEREYRIGDLRGYVLVISATGDPIVNDQIVGEASAEGIWLNVVDDPERSDFYFTAIHRAGDVVISVSTGGASPALAQEVRSLIRRHLPDNLADTANRLRSERRALHDAGRTSEGINWRARIHYLLSGATSTTPESSDELK